MDVRTKDFLDLLFKWNRAYRITAFLDSAEAETQGVTPSLAAGDLIAPGASILDVGSGGGFPAIPLMLARPDVTVVLCEPSRAKAAFLREVLVRFSLPGRVEPRTAEEALSMGGGPWDAVTVRGVHLRHGLLKRLAAALSPGGILLIWSAGDRARQYAHWLSFLGLETEERPLPAAGLVLLYTRVPRGTS